MKLMYSFKITDTNVTRDEVKMWPVRVPLRDGKDSKRTK